MILAAGSIVLILAGFMIIRNTISDSKGKEENAMSMLADERSTSPLLGKALYRDDQRSITKLAAEFTKQGKADDAALLSRITSQPGSTWLTGPSESDPTAANDVSDAARTSQEAAASDTTPVYVLYALPGRDACAGFSKGGFVTNEQYVQWIAQIRDSLQTPSIIILEPDSIAHADEQGCLTTEKREARYSLLKSTVETLSSSQQVLGVYLDAGNAEWKPDPKTLIDHLRKSGIDQARGIAVNVSSFVDTDQTISWSQAIIDRLGSDKGIIIDTSRNGTGAAPKNVTGTARWCNPAGRGLGTVPTTTTDKAYIDAYIWVKNAGESDGDCFGNPPAGTLDARLALELARNAKR